MLKLSAAGLRFSEQLTIYFLEKSVMLQLRHNAMSRNSSAYMAGKHASLSLPLWNNPEEKERNKLRGPSPRANYTDRSIAACQRS
jgi:hypothetical protein